MPRPSRKAERAEQIYAAFLHCVARYGVDGASLERIAEQAGLQRSMIRHFVGNRDVLVTGLAERLERKFTEQTAAMIELLPSERPAETMIDWLFDPSYVSDHDAVLALEALIAAVPRFPEVGVCLHRWFSTTVEQFTEVVARSHPQADAEAQRDVALGVIGIYFNNDALSPLGLAADYREGNHRAALRLLRTLESA